MAGPENLRSANGKAQLIYRFQARDLHLIMGTSAAGKAVKFRVLIDGRPPAALGGVDLDSLGYGTVREPRMYQLIRQPGTVKELDCQIEFNEPGVDVYDVTFG